MNTKILNNCLLCGSQFELNKSGRKRIYCSRKCNNEHWWIKARAAGFEGYNKKRKPAVIKTNLFVFCVDCNCFFDFNEAHDYSNQGRPRSKSLCLSCSKKRKRNCANCFKYFFPVSTGGYNASYCRSCVNQMRKMHKKGIKIKDTLEPRECNWCLKFFMPRGNRSKCCRRNCQLMSNEYKRRTGLNERISVLIKCDCGKLIGARFRKCNDCAFNNRSKSMQRRLLAQRQGDAGIHWRVVGDRDDWLCHLCGEEVLKKAGTAYEPFGATVDHLIPIAKDGTHTWGNVALAHRHCNVVRGADDLEVPIDES
jgi:endogenous inhibitor of DNA gyrase (YacG/DUF329 family)